MKKRLFLLFVLICFAAGVPVNAAGNSKTADIIVKNRLFSISVPKDLKGFYTTVTQKDRISVYHKQSRKAGFGGFAFGVKAYKNPADHAELPGGRKIGELTDKKGTVYDMVLKYPTDVQYDYTKSQEAPESYKRLYDLGETVKIEGVKGSTYYKDRGMKGQDLYKDILQNHVTAINEKWDSTKLEKENMSYMYYVVSKSDKNVLDRFGYIYYDLNADGIDELLIGEIAQGEWKGVIYDIYTIVNRKPKHVISGGSRNRYYACNGTFICNEYSAGALESGVRITILVENSTELFPQVNFKYDAYTNSDKPWFLSYSDEEWENVSEKKYNERIEVFNKYKRFDFIPLSSLKF